jgi:hypothetical protein
MKLYNHVLTDEEPNGLEEFAKWVLDVGDGAVQVDTRAGDATPSWISLLPDIALLLHSDHVFAIVYAAYDSFSDMYSDASYLA